MGRRLCVPSSASRVSTQSIWLENTVPKLREMDSATAFRSSDLPSSCCIEVTGFAVMPQGMIRLKKLRSVFTLRAKP